MLPLNYAILQLFLTAEQADTTTVMTDLEPTYSKYRQFNRRAITESLMTAEANGLLEETDFTLTNDQQIDIFYRATDSGRAMITRYIGLSASPATT